MTQFIPTFIFNRKLPEAYEELVIQDFVRLYDEAVEEINKHLDEWNEEFKLDTRIPGVIFLYNRFLRKREFEVLEPINEKAEKNMFCFLTLDVDRKACLFGRLKGVEQITVHMTFEPKEIEA